VDVCDLDGGLYGGDKERRESFEDCPPGEQGGIRRRMFRRNPAKAQLTRDGRDNHAIGQRLGDHGIVTDTHVVTDGDTAQNFGAGRRGEVVPDYGPVSVTSELADNVSVDERAAPPDAGGGTDNDSVRMIDQKPGADARSA